MGFELGVVFFDIPKLLSQTLIFTWIFVDV